MTLLEVHDITVEFPLHRSFVDTLMRKPQPVLRAVDGVDLSVERGEIRGVVGESGCGKSTLARAIVGLVEPVEGEIVFNGSRLAFDGRENRRHVQMVFQDPSSSLNPSMTIGAMLAELITYHRLRPSEQVHDRCEELMDLVNLPRRYLAYRPMRLSGGQRQRIGIARALALEPDLLIADESVAALDVSVQASILNLLLDLRDGLDLTIILISHDLAVVRNVCDHVSVMYMGNIVESGQTAELFASPAHPYTTALLAAAPSFDGSRRPGDARLEGEPPSPLARPSGCPFNPRCLLADDECRTAMPPLEMIDGRLVACHKPFASTRRGTPAPGPPAGK
jgi:oligopeptide transport system ATP-binding protein